MATNLNQSPFSPNDVFRGSNVRRRFKQAVLQIIEQTATVRQSFIEGTMVYSAEGDEWILPLGKAVRTPSLWGSPSILYVEPEIARAEILKTLGVDIGPSPTYRKYMEKI